jgi:hypothetical protein
MAFQLFPRAARNQMGRIAFGPKIKHLFKKIYDIKKTTA